MSNKISEDPKASRSWVFTEDDFKSIAVVARKHFGLALSESKTSLIQSRLAKRMDILEFTDFSQYLDRLNGPAAAEERQELLSVLTTNVTHFFREEHHFETLTREVLEKKLDAVRAGGRLRIWSAGCSKGPEAYSIAMTVLETFPDAAKYDIKILATDIDPVVVATAEEGVYPGAEICGIPQALRNKYVSQPSGDDSEGTMKDQLKQLIKFKVLNLIEPFPFRGPFDAIFCRNVAIYFDQDTQSGVWQQLVNYLPPKAYLFIGHSERLCGPGVVAMSKAGFTTFQKSG